MATKYAKSSCTENGYFWKLRSLRHRPLGLQQGRHKAICVAHSRLDRRPKNAIDTYQHITLATAQCDMRFTVSLLRKPPAHVRSSIQNSRPTAVCPGNSTGIYCVHKTTRVFACGHLVLTSEIFHNELSAINSMHTCTWSHVIHSISRYKRPLSTGLNMLSMCNAHDWQVGHAHKGEHVIPKESGLRYDQPLRNQEHSIITQQHSAHLAAIAGQAVPVPRAMNGSLKMVQ